MRRALVLLVVVAALIAGCGGSQSADSSTTSTSSPAGQGTTTVPVSATDVTTTQPSANTTTTTEPSTATTTTTEPPTTTTTTTEPPTTTTTLPVGEQTAGPPSGSEWIVVGVAFDDVLNVREGPSARYPVVGTLVPTAEAIVASGFAVLQGSSIWWEIESAGTSGWVNSLYLAARGSTDDVTSSVVAYVGRIPAESTMEELAGAVYLARTGMSPSGGQPIVVAAASTDGDIGEIVIDVLPSEPDDSIRGERLHVFGQRDGGSGPFSLYAVEATSLCWRGVDAAGLCV